MTTTNRKNVRLVAPTENARGLPVSKPRSIRVAVAPKKMTMADFLKSDMSARKRVYMDALAKSTKEQDDLIEEALRLSPA